MEGNENIDELMAPVLMAIKKHVSDKDAITEIYNRAYEALMISLDINSLNEQRIESAGDLLEQISLWFYKRAGYEQPFWTDEYKSLCKLFEPFEVKDGRD